MRIDRLPRFRTLAELTATLAVCAFSMMLASGCATQRAPEGGPVDMEPPRILATTPSNGSTLFAGSEISFEFDEYVDRQSFTQAFHLSPLTEPQPEFRWSGRRVDVVFRAPLRDSTTYVATIGSTVRDRRNGNTLGNSFTLAFSTGEKIDQGMLQGRVYDEKPAGVSIFAYRLAQRLPDTLRPSALKPDYAVQTSTDGSFLMSNIAGGTYRLLAVRDKQNNALYDVEADAFGVLRGDIPVTEGDSTGTPLAFRLAIEDTTRPSMQSARALHAFAVQLRLSEEVDSVIARQLAVRDSASGETNQVLAVRKLPAARFAYVVFLARPLARRMYELRIDSLCDAAGNCADESERRIFFEGSADADTAAIRLVTLRPAAGQKDVPVDGAFEAHFSHPMSRNASVTLRDSSNRALELQPVWASPLALRIEHAPLRASESYTLCLNVENFTDSIGNRSAGDTLRCVTFTTAGESGAGSISGIVRADTAPRATYRVRARAVIPAMAPNTVHAAADGSFTLPSVPAGKYMLEAFDDEDGNGVWSPGRPYPFKPSERFGLMPDTVRVRSRWETRGTIIRLH